MGDFLETPIQYYMLGSQKLGGNRKTDAQEFRGLGVDVSEAQDLSSTGNLVVQNMFFMVWQLKERAKMAIWCLDGRGHVLSAVDDPRSFKLTVRCHGTEKAVVKLLKSVNELSLQCFGTVTQEPAPVTLLRKALGMTSLNCGFKSIQECISEYWDAMNAEWGTSTEEYISGMQCCELAPGIFHIEFAHQLLMASTMLRLQERYECPCAELRGRCFSVAEYKAWERKHDPAHGFTYYDRWPGFNVPGEVVRDALLGEELLPREEALKWVLRDALSMQMFYVIGSLSSDDETLYHEVCHAMYEVNADYRTDIDEYLATVPTGVMRRMKAWLRCEQYADVDRILQDEVHAYLSEGSMLGCKPRETAVHTKSLRRIFSDHADNQLVHLIPSDDDWSDSSSSDSS